MFSCSWSPYSTTLLPMNIQNFQRSFREGATHSEILKDEKRHLKTFLNINKDHPGCQTKRNHNPGGRVTDWNLFGQAYSSLLRAQRCQYTVVLASSDDHLLPSFSSSSTFLITSTSPSSSSSPHSLPSPSSSPSPSPVEAAPPPRPYSVKLRSSIDKTMII